MLEDRTMMIIMDSTNNDSQICVTSYNSTGFSQNKIDCMKTLMLFSDIFCLQEHFLMTSKDKKQSNTNKIRNAFGQECDMFITPAFKANSEVSYYVQVGWVSKP